MTRVISFFLLGLAIALGGMTGCRKTAMSKSMQQSPQNLMSFGKAYREATLRLGQPPASLDQMAQELKDLGDTDQLLRSPEDNENYVIHWGAAAHANPAHVLAYEKVGKDGKRYVLWGHIVWFLTDEELKTKPFPPGYRAPAK
ncbi:MAG: hypothetical protein EXS16_21055 [Gemmataceae bacterium]|nr:hypothetical protein [Gemmataceae bacterium]